MGSDTHSHCYLIILRGIFKIVIFIVWVPFFFVPGLIPNFVSEKSFGVQFGSRE